MGYFVTFLVTVEALKVFGTRYSALKHGVLVLRVTRRQLLLPDG